MPPCVTLVTLPCVHEFMFHASSHLRLIDRSILRLLVCATNQLKAAEHKYEKGKPRRHGDTERHEEVADHCVGSFLVSQCLRGFLQPTVHGSILPLITFFNVRGSFIVSFPYEN